MLPDKTETQSLKAGAAQVDITPAPGIPLTGFILREGPSTGIHDRLFAKALALEAGGQQALLIACDLLALDARFVAAVRAAIHDALGIPETNIMLVCTHTHSGPATVYLRDCGEVDTAYLDNLRLCLVAAARDAQVNLRAARMGVGRGQVNLGVFNRRQPGAWIDPDLGVAGFQDETGKVFAILLNYACHPVCLDHTNRLISADYPGYLARRLREETGAVVLFTNGAAGDINPERKGSFSFAEDLGHALAAEALHVLEGLAYRDAGDLWVAGETLELPLAALPASAELKSLIGSYQAGLAEAEAAGDALNVKVQRAMLGWAEDTLAGALRGGLPAAVPAEIQVVDLGAVRLAGIPGEIFSQLGKEIKDRARPREVWVLGYANNDVGYIATRQAYALGGYEIHDAYKYYGYPAALAPEAGDLLRQAAYRLFKPDPCEI